MITCFGVGSWNSPFEYLKQIIVSRDKIAIVTQA